ncbi:hypothetical protein DXG01_011088 [Tephrocybe rancida]|nr:hypothetical protein DXG01_011088 [Tephrocybe rancida]
MAGSVSTTARGTPSPRTVVLSSSIWLEMTVETIIIDDVNPRIVYTGFWERAGSFEEFKSTTHGASGAGAQATFKFNGSSIAVFGTIGRENNNGDPRFAPVTTYRIDGSTPETFTHKPNRGIVYRQLFFQAHDLEEGPGKEHTLVMENTITGKNMVWLDYLQLISSTERPPPEHPSPAAPIEGTYSRALLKGMFMGSAMTIMLFVCLLALAHRRRMKRAHNSGDSAPDFHSYQRNRRSNRSGSSAFDDQLQVQVALLGEGEDEIAEPTRGSIPDQQPFANGSSLATMSTGLYGVQTYKRAVPIDKGGALENEEPKTMIAGSSSRTQNLEDTPPAYES